MRNDRTSELAGGIAVRRMRFWEVVWRWCFGGLGWGCWGVLGGVGGCFRGGEAGSREVSAGKRPLALSFLAVRPRFFC